MFLRGLVMCSSLGAWLRPSSIGGRMDSVPAGTRTWFGVRAFGHQPGADQLDTSHTTGTDQYGDNDHTAASEQAFIVMPMPKLSHAMTHGRIARWHLQEGAAVNMYDVLLTVETETLVEKAYQVDEFAGKVALLVESQEEGFVARLLAAEGEEVPVGKPIALLCEQAELVPVAKECATRIGGVENVYDRACSPRLRLLEWQSYLARGKPSNGCL